MANTRAAMDRQGPQHLSMYVHSQCLESEAPLPSLRCRATKIPSGPALGHSKYPRPDHDQIPTKTLGNRSASDHNTVLTHKHTKIIMETIKNAASSVGGKVSD